MLLEKTMPAALVRAMPEIATTFARVHVEARNRHHARAPLGRLFAHYLMSAWSRCLAWRLSRETRRTLRSLDDRILADIGLKRSEIDAVFFDKQPKLRGRSE
jgi:uncharacterized protein YjiS (DUF1127 family)